MARHKKHEAFDSPTPALDISSLTDVCFLLLIYFLVTSTITPRESDLGMSLPTPFPIRTDPPVIEPLFIDITSTGEIRSGPPGNSIPMDTDPSSRELPLLQGQLQMYARATRAANSTPLVKIHADEAVTHQRVIDVLNTLAAVHIHSVRFTEAGGSQPLD